MRAIVAIIRKNLTGFARDKVRLFMSLVMPLFMLFACSFIMSSSATNIDSPINYLIAGVDITIVFQGVINNSAFVLNDISSGFMKEIIVAPVSRRDIAIGNILSTSIFATIQGLMVLMIGFAFGFETTLLGFINMILLMMFSSIVLSSFILFLSLVAKNQANYQIISSIIIMPAMFLSGAYIPTTIIPKIILPLVYINPLTYLTSAFRFVALNMFDLSIDELVRQGVAFQFGVFTITPVISWISALVIGIIFFFLCINKFKRINLLEVKGRTGGRRR